MRILCFGDSNTYGYDPRAFSGGRYPAESRWVNLLAQKTGHAVVNAGQNGREIPRGAEEFFAFESLLTRHAPIDLLLVLLGYNDLLQGNSVAAVAARMGHFLSHIPLPKERVCLIAPPPMRRGEWVAEEGLPAASVQLAAAYAALADRMGVSCIHTGDWDIAMAFDGVHFSEAGSKAFGEKLCAALEKVGR